MTIAKNSICRAKIWHTLCLLSFCMETTEQNEAINRDLRSSQDLLKLKEQDETAFVIAAAAYLDISPFVVPSGFIPDAELLGGKKSEFWLKAKAIPLMKVGEGTTVAFSDPFDLPAREEILRVTGGTLWCVVAPEKGILDAIGRVKSAEDAANPTLAMENIMKGQDAEIEFTSSEVKDEAIEASVETADEAPVIRMVNSMMIEALKTKAEGGYTNHAGNVIAGFSVALTQTQVSLSEEGRV